ncbi:uncharacterized protein EV422DRAFT_566899 [Fimicolochytrium jonesii]|uniref:uncharacterized protein n=1 Tax=Fimicolochytrium jonesii TaxID=1396493 RepID=UPI0022FE4FBC|nr:uncharacterized protein EV422DRAFT_566899 [Fimicolochytrium jonesii]KAI8821821.1 hypothetical protein EV422DRAFT_566899 [Fimicolochytrium jonesii]
MTLPEPCVAISDKFRACVDRENLWGRLLGRCDVLKEELEKCLRKEYIGKKRSSLKSSRERRKKWEEANTDIGVESPAK